MREKDVIETLHVWQPVAFINSWCVKCMPCPFGCEQRLLLVCYFIDLLNLHSRWPRLTFSVALQGRNPPRKAFRIDRKDATQSRT